MGWVSYPAAYGYWPCKNDLTTAARLSAAGVPPMGAATSEMAVYAMHCAMLRAIGADVGVAAACSFRSVGVDVGPAVVLAPDFAPCLTRLAAKLPTPSKIRVSARSSLVVRGRDVTIRHLDLDGALDVHVEEGGSLVIESLHVANEGWEFVELSDEEMREAPEVQARAAAGAPRRMRRAPRACAAGARHPRIPPRAPRDAHGARRTWRAHCDRRGLRGRPEAGGRVAAAHCAQGFAHAHLDGQGGIPVGRRAHGPSFLIGSFRLRQTT